MIAFSYLLLASLVQAANVAPTVYPGGYDESRDRFRQGCADSRPLAPGFCRAFPVPSDKHPDLTVDTAFFGRGGSRLLVLQSGTHGPEAYTGAAIQELVRTNLLESLLDRGIDVLFIHALNPFGFREGRRADERNVNLNRNFFDAPESFRTKNEAYRMLRETFEPSGVVRGPARSYVATDLSLLWQLARYREVRPISEAMNKGQYEFERGINFGGFGPSAQVGILRELLTPLLASHARVIFIDFHTGLGEADTLHLMTALRSSPAMVAALKPALNGLAEQKIRTTVSATDAGFFATTGGVEEYPAMLAPPGTTVLAMTAEFGTMGTSIPAQLRSAHRIIVENQAWFNGCSDDEVCRRVHRDFVELFNPPDETWRAGVLRQAELLLRTLAAHFP